MQTSYLREEPPWVFQTNVRSGYIAERRRSIATERPLLADSPPLVQIVKLEEQFAKVALVRVEPRSEILWSQEPVTPIEQVGNQLLGQIGAGRSLIQERQADRSVRGDHKPELPLPAEATEPIAVPSGELLVAIDDYNRPCREVLAAQVDRQTSLAVVQLNQERPPARAVDPRNERGYKRRLAASVRADDLALPSILA